MTRLLIVSASLLFAFAAWADEAGDCQGAAGRLVSGVVVSGPRFTPGHPRRGVELSHTHVTLRSDADWRSYDVAIDNVFAEGYDQCGGGVPAPLSALKWGDRLEVCGKPYTNGRGVDWVRTDCGDEPTREAPDGWAKVIGPGGEISDLHSRQGRGRAQKLGTTPSDDAWTPRSGAWWTAGVSSETV